MCEYCEDEKTLLYTSDCNSIYIGKNNIGEICIINSDTYTGNQVKVSYCPICGKKLG